jgi:NAD(P)H dehydrogenase (quinone)
LNILIVHAHPEPQSFSSSLANATANTLRELGHEVVVSDLFAMGFQPVSDRRNFTSVKDAGYYKQQMEEMYATEHGGFAAELDAEMKKLESADLLVFSFPLWWFGMPAILKGWVDKVFAMGRVYGGAKLYECGVGSSRGARAMVLMTTGGVPASYGGRGVNPPLRAILEPINHGVFWFNGYEPLEPFVAWSVARVGDEERAGYLTSLRERLAGIFEEKPLELPPLQDFPQFGLDTKKRFVVSLHLKRVIDEALLAKVPEERAHIAEMQRTGFLLEYGFSPNTAAVWRGFLTVRAATEAEVLERLHRLPMAEDLEFEVVELA